MSGQTLISSFLLHAVITKDKVLARFAAGFKLNLEGKKIEHILMFSFQYFPKIFQFTGNNPKRGTHEKLWGLL